MNDTKLNSASIPEEIDAIAAAWVGRRDAGLTLEEENELRSWRGTDVRHESAFARFEAAWSVVGRPRRTGTAAEFTLEMNRLVRRKRQRRAAVAAACSLAFALGGSLWWANRGEPAMVARARPAAQVVMISPGRQVLPDGSVAEFRPGTELAVDFSGKIRRVSLRKGEALFHVEKNPERPFVVDARGVEARALGTVFSVQLAAEAVEVLVTEGSVRVDPPRDIAATTRAEAAPASVVHAGERTVVALTTVAAPPIISVPAEEVAQRLAWRMPHVEFSGAPLAEVIAVLNQHNRVQFSIDDPALASVPLSGLFRADDTEAFMRLLESGFGVKAEPIGAEKIVLRRAR